VSAGRSAGSSGSLRFSLRNRESVGSRAKPVGAGEKRTETRERERKVYREPRFPVNSTTSDPEIASKPTRDQPGPDRSISLDPAKVANWSSCRAGLSVIFRAIGYSCRPAPLARPEKRNGVLRCSISISRSMRKGDREEDSRRLTQLDLTASIIRVGANERGQTGRYNADKLTRGGTPPPPPVAPVYAFIRVSVLFPAAMRFREHLTASTPSARVLIRDC